jgi:CBS domain-containing protein
MMNALDRLRMLRVADAMSRSVVTVSSKQTMLDVARKFVEHDVVAAPVVEDDGRCVGFFSAADLLRRELKVRQESATADAATDQTAGQAEVHRFMSKKVHSLLPGESLLKAARTMCEQHLHRLPVVDDQGRVVGIISTMDIVAAVVNAVDEMNATTFPDAGPPRKRS